MADTERTQTEILALFADNVTGDIGEQDLRDSVVSARANQGGGWANYIESVQISQGTALAISADARTQITCNGLGFGSDSTQKHGMTEPWLTNKLRVETNCAYNVRILFKGQIASGAGGHYLTIELDDGVRTIWHGIDLFAKGAGVEHAFQYSIPSFAWPDFVTNGGTIYVTPDTDMDLWGMAVFVNRTYQPDN